ncbi:hypothetical protein ACEZDB_20455 [Streptacidiphilus sp. N1-3]|uniref:Uncharacterized protein n=1 Tax=Streptacidiphilus alkalitolerans TaxID=3342712 RepID=A0ABV6X412_9ACTN
MNPAAVVALLHRASHTEQRIAGTLNVREVAEVQQRLQRRVLDRIADRAFGGASRLTRFLGGGIDVDLTDRPDRSIPFEPGQDVPGLDDLLRPGWLLTGFELSVAAEQPPGRGVERGVGRGVLATATPRPAALPDGRAEDSKLLLSRIDLLMDRELGILLRTEEFFEGELCRTVELSDLVLDPLAAEPEAEGEAEEIPVVTPEDPFAGLEDGIPAPVRLVARGLGSALGEAVRIGARLRPVAEPEDEEPWFDPSSEPQAIEEDQDQDALVWLLHRSGRSTPRFTAELHSWLDVGALLDAFRSLRESEPALGGFFGPEPLWSAFGETAPRRRHRAHRLVFADLLHYRLDTLLDVEKQPVALACDGAAGYRLFPDRLMTLPPAPPEFDLAQALDLSWLLRHEVAAEGLVEYGGRTALRVAVTGAAGDSGGAPYLLFERLEVLVDVELGVGLRLTAHQDGSAVARCELRNLVVASAAPGKLPEAADEVFTLTAPPGGSTHRSSGGPFGDSTLPSPLKAAVGAAGTLAGGAVMLAGLLGRKRPQPEPESQPPTEPGPRPEPPVPPAPEA